MSNKIIFGGVDSSTYGIYVSGEGVFNAPVRDAEMISIPGRNGSYLLDHGRFQNIQVRYPVFNQEADKATFIQKIDAFRNAIASLKGYQRLEDTFHSDEYRMASFIGGMEVNPILYNDHSSTFELVFDCKPQRFLTSGETKVNLNSTPSTVTNPTLFDSHPMLEVYGYGNINLNGYDIDILDSGEAGNIPLTGLIENTTGTDLFKFDVPRNLYNSGDWIKMRSVVVNLDFETTSPNAGVISFSDFSVTGTDVGWGYSFEDGNLRIRLEFANNGRLFEFQSANISRTASLDFIIHYYNSNHVHSQAQVTGATVSMSYVDSTGRFTIDSTGMPSLNGLRIGQYSSVQWIRVDSTLPTLGTPLYIDCETGEAYAQKPGGILPANNGISMGSNLPILSPGTNTITHDNTVTDLKMIPRWWKI